MSSGSLSTEPVSPPVLPPFSAALALHPLGSGRYRAELGHTWSVGGGKQHGGLLLALVTKAGLAGLGEHSRSRNGSTNCAPTSDPLAVSAEFLRAPEMGPAQLVTEVLKVGRTASVVRSELFQGDRLMLTATITAGRLPTVSAESPAEWTNLPELAAEPPDDAPATSQLSRATPLSRACELRIDPASAHYLRGERGAPTLRGWVRPHGEPPDTLFALFAGDILPPLLYNRGQFGWAPTVQLTALIRADPRPGWLRLESAARTIAGGWLDEDMTVIDSAGRLVCQARQLALAPLPRG
jgi:acyl-coenzyme A thioesterase PaaI-like protein